MSIHLKTIEVAKQINVYDLSTPIPTWLSLVAYIIALPLGTYCGDKRLISLWPSLLVYTTEGYEKVEIGEHSSCGGHQTYLYPKIGDWTIY